MGWEKEVKLGKERLIIFRRHWLTMNNSVDFRIEGNRVNHHKGFKSQIKIKKIGCGTLNILTGDFDGHTYLCLSVTEEEVRKAWLSVEDELVRRGWINIDEKKEDLK